jgi:hypothetical protein
MQRLQSRLVLLRSPFPVLVAVLVLALGAMAACDDVVEPDQRLAPTSASAHIDDFTDHVHGPGEGTHLRGGNLTWRAVGTNRAEFTFTVTFRRSFYYGAGQPSVGQQATFASLAMGDGSVITPLFTVTFVDHGEDWFEARAVFEKQYGSAGPFTVSNDVCCRLSAGRFPWDLRNNGDQVFRVRAEVNFASAGAPTTGLPPVITCPLEGDCRFNVPATSRAGQPVRWRMATSVEMNGNNPGPPQAPNSATVDPATGLYQWDTRGANAPDRGAGWNTVYSTQVALESLDSNGNPVAKSVVDFLIHLTDVALNAPPEFDVPPSPADGSAFTVHSGQNLTVQVQASDPDEDDTVTLSALGLPAGASFTPGAAGNTATGTFSWTPQPGQEGDYVVNFRAVDSRGLNAAPLSITISVPSNAPPVADAGEDQVVECDAHGAGVALDGSGSYDPDGDIVAYEWLDATGALVATGPTPTVGLGLGTHTLTLRVTDDGGLTAEDQVQVTVEDTTPPDVQLAVTPDVLWPANHTYHAITVTAAASDGCTDADGLVITGHVVSSEPDNARGNGDGNTTGDIRVTRADGTVLLSSDDDPVVAFNPLTDTLELRAERAGNGSGRTYTITVTATDASGNAATATATVVVPHNQGNGKK